MKLTQEQKHSIWADAFNNAFERSQDEEIAEESANFVLEEEIERLSTKLEKVLE